MHRGVLTLALLITFAPITLAQNNFGTITGTIRDPDKNIVAGIDVQAKQASGMVYKTQSSQTGTFSLQQLPAGTYELFVPLTGFTFFPYSKKDLVVAAGSTLEADIQLEWPINLGTIGDDTFLTIRNRYSGISGPAPRTADGKPDFSGIWNGNGDPAAEDAAILPWAAEIKKQRMDNFFRDTPSSYCLPGEVYPSSPLIYKIVQTPTLFLEILEDIIGVRQIYMDGRSHPKTWDPNWLGHSIGHWEGDTLVIDTIGYNDKSWLPDGVPHTEMLHVIERYRRPDVAHLTMDITIEDPGTLTKPWNLHQTWELAPGEEVLEYVCTENNQFRDHGAGK